jgi:hypothetical protein
MLLSTAVASVGGGPTPVSGTAPVLRADPAYNSVPNSDALPSESNRAAQNQFGVANNSAGIFNSPILAIIGVAAVLGYFIWKE